MSSSNLGLENIVLTAEKLPVICCVGVGESSSSSRTRLGLEEFPWRRLIKAASSRADDICIELIGVNEENNTTDNSRVYIWLAFTKVSGGYNRKAGKSYISIPSSATCFLVVSYQVCQSGYHEP